MRLPGLSPNWWLNVLITAAAVALYVGPTQQYGPLMEPHLPWWSIAVGFLIAERCVVHLQFGRSAHSFSLGDIPLVFGLLFTSAHGLVLAGLIGTGIVMIADRRLPLVKLVFNLGQFALSTSMAIVLLNLLVSPGQSFGPDVWLAAFLAAQVSALMAVLLIGAAISYAEGRVRMSTLVQMLAMDTAVTLTNTSLALAGALVIATDARAAPLLLVPAVTVFLAYRAYLLERQRHEKLEFLYETTRTLSRSPEIVMALEGLLARSLEAFRAELAEIVLFSSDGSQPLRTTLGPGAHKEVMQPMDPDVAAALMAAAETGGPVVRLTEPFEDEKLRHYLQARRVTTAMVAVLPGEQRTIGTLMLANRLGVMRAFGDDDLMLLATLANNASVALQYDRMEQAVLQLRELQEQLEHRAFHDPLTDLANRSLFMRQVHEALSGDGNEDAAVLFIDVDDFKTVNDSLGHLEGDKLLVSVAKRLTECVRPDDTVARLGGDEFAVMVRDDRDVERAALEVTERIMAAFRRPLEAGEEMASVHVSVGIATTGQGSGQAAELIRDADVAMYQAKAAGKHRYEFFAPPMRSAVFKRHALKEELQKAIDRDQLAVLYQPIFDLASGEMVAAEALVRWRHPGRGQLSPNEFVPLAEETGLIVAVGEFVLAEACKQAKRWSAIRGSSSLPSIHVNLSAVELLDPWLSERVSLAIEAAEIEPEQLVLEITESTLVEDYDSNSKLLEQLQRSGVRLALDDFGTGYSSLSHLRLLPLDILKIAMPFVTGLDRNQRDSSFARMIIDLAGALGLRVVAEGIESEAEHRVLCELGCELGQGFYLAEPLDARSSAYPPVARPLRATA